MYWRLYVQDLYLTKKSSSRFLVTFQVHWTHSLAYFSDLTDWDKPRRLSFQTARMSAFSLEAKRFPDSSWWLCACLMSQPMLGMWLLCLQCALDKGKGCPAIPAMSPPSNRSNLCPDLVFQQYITSLLPAAKTQPDNDNEELWSNVIYKNTFSLRTSLNELLELFENSMETASRQRDDSFKTASRQLENHICP